ncbi:hypothetical protein C8R43DRAFT_657578 [Mycena crocata]|nr:hypothetical protein C8R43DRAFT_657578 [Mycena crocata]
MTPIFTLLSALLPVIYLFFHSANASATNITIDDTNSTFFTYTQSWNAVTLSTPCPTCFWQLDASQLYNNSWHDAAESRSASCTFRGSAIYLYGVDVPNGANISFTMNTPAIQAYHHYDGDAAVYRALLFHASDLEPSTEHTLTWLLTPAADGGSVGIIDYAIVTQVDSAGSAQTSSAGSPKASPKIRLIVGAVVGGIGTLALLVLISFVLWRRSKQRSRSADVMERERDMGSRDPLLVVPFRESPPSESGSASSSIYPSSRKQQTPEMSVVGTESASWSGREHELEERVRDLEAQVEAQAPPPY